MSYAVFRLNDPVDTEIRPWKDLWNIIRYSKEASISPGCSHGFYYVGDICPAAPIFKYVRGNDAIEELKSQMVAQGYKLAPNARLLSSLESTIASRAFRLRGGFGDSSSGQYENQLIEVQRIGEGTPGYTLSIAIWYSKSEDYKRFCMPVDTASIRTWVLLKGFRRAVSPQLTSVAWENRHQQKVNKRVVLTPPTAQWLDPAYVTALRWTNPEPIEYLAGAEHIYTCTPDRHPTVSVDLLWGTTASGQHISPRTITVPNILVELAYSIDETFLNFENDGVIGLGIPRSSNTSTPSQSFFAKLLAAQRPEAEGIDVS
ncbi:hypothetical protein OF83DRAFT_718525 [Amylostereum chailletii]|nr:hypothetical protein OF83DRAFT_718525 [Amylostereum chailletii]